MSLSNIEIALAATLLTAIVVGWYMYRVMLRPVRDELKAMEEQVKDNKKQVANLLEAWAKSIAICSTCGSLLFTTSKSKSIRHGKVTAFYCQDCKDEA